MINETKFVILPIPETFPISSYLPLSIIAAISLANQSNNEWIYLNFIQLVIRNGTEKLESFPNQDYMYFPQQNLSITNLVDENFIFDKRYLEKNRRKGMIRREKNWQADIKQKQPCMKH